MDYSDHDHVDDFVRLLQLAPELNESTANWTRIVMQGTRRQHQTAYYFKNNMKTQPQPQIDFLILVYLSDCSFHCAAVIFMFVVLAPAAMAN